MSTSNSKLLEFFTHILKLEPDGSNWVIFKDCFLYVADAASLKPHVDGTGKVPVAIMVVSAGALTEQQAKELKEYEEALTKWQVEEAIIRQAIASIIPDSLFLEVRKKETALEMWEAVKSQQEKKSRMVTVNMRHRLQAKKCLEQGDVRTHLNKLLAMHEDLTSMGESISDEDFTTIILGSILLSYDTYIAAIMATSTLLNQTLSPTNLIDAIHDEADCHAIRVTKVQFSSVHPLFCLNCEPNRLGFA
jgi:hypothetical protein